MIIIVRRNGRLKKFVQDRMNDILRQEMQGDGVCQDSIDV
jgi:hypothetical protein